MRRSLRAFRATVSELERRALQARVVVLAPPPALASLPSTDSANFGGTPASDGSTVLTQEVGQQAGVATVILSRSNSNFNLSDPLQVRVTTDPSPYVGVNVGAVDQVVTFPPGQPDAVLAVPLIAGAPNPGEVDVDLRMTPVDPSRDLSIQVSVDELRILASDAAIPPAIVATNGTPQGLQLIFNKPMDPAQASNVKNYAVTWQTVVINDSGGLLGWALFGMRSRLVTTPVPLKAAVYDAATNTVTLVPRRRFSYDPNFDVTQASPPRAAARANAGAAHGLVDLEGHPIEQTGTPGKFAVTVAKGLSA